MVPCPGSLVKTCPLLRSEAVSGEPSKKKRTGLQNSSR
jgi:hypothetical protein